MYSTNLNSFFIFQVKPIEVNTSIPHDICPALSSLDEIPPYLAPSVDGLMTLLDKSVWLQVRDIPPSS